jgi:hypothetical protein
MRNFVRKLKRGNDLLGHDQISAGTGTFTNATITTGTITTGNITNAFIATKLVIPTTAYTGAGMTEGALYATGAYIYVGRGGAWVSGSVG